MTKKRTNPVVARMTMTRPNNIKTIVEIHEGAGFMNFYTWYRQDGRKRKVLLRTSSRNDGVAAPWRAPFVPLGLETLAARTAQIMNDVSGVTIKILKKRKYAEMLACPASDLAGGLPRAAKTAEIIDRAKGIPVSIPTGYIPLQKRMDIMTGVKR